MVIDETTSKTDHCYYLYNSELSGTYGSSLTDEEMKVQSNFVGFDFTDIWSISPQVNNGYPYLINSILPKKENVSTEVIPGESVTKGETTVTGNDDGTATIKKSGEDENVITVTLPNGKNVSIDENGVVIVPSGSEVSMDSENGSGAVVTLPNGGNISLATACVKITVEYNVTGVLTNVKTETIKLSEITTAENTATYKVFYWRSLTGMQPLAQTR